MLISAIRENTRPSLMMLSIFISEKMPLSHTFHLVHPPVKSREAFVTDEKEVNIFGTLEFWSNSSNFESEGFSKPLCAVVIHKLEYLI